MEEVAIEKEFREQMEEGDLGEFFEQFDEVTLGEEVWPEDVEFDDEDDPRDIDIQ